MMITSLGVNLLTWNLKFQRNLPSPSFLFKNFIYSFQKLILAFLECFYICLISLLSMIYGFFNMWVGLIKSCMSLGHVVCVDHTSWQKIHPMAVSNRLTYKCMQNLVFFLKWMKLLCWILIFVHRNVNFTSRYKGKFSSSSKCWKWCELFMWMHIMVLSDIHG